MSHQDEITFQNNGKIVSEEWVQNAFKNKRQKKDWNKEKFQIKIMNTRKYTILEFWKYSINQGYIQGDK